MPESEFQENRIFRFLVGEATHGLRLSRAVAMEVPGLSVRAAKSLVDNGRVFVDRRRVLKASMRVEGGERIEVHVDRIPLSPSLCWEDIVWKQGSLVAVNKPAGLLVYGTRGVTEDTVVPQITRLLKDRGEWKRGDRLLLVHRLDRDTSGLLLLARNTRTARFLEKQFFQREVKKRYRVLVEGIPGMDRFRRVAAVAARRPPGESFAGRGNAEAGSGHPREKKQDAVTEFKVLECYSGCSLLEATPSTGHTHQIRIHLAQLGHPVLGDMLYGTQTVRKSFFRAVSRQMLHAEFLGLRDPDTEKSIRLHAPVPEDMQRILDELKSKG